MWVKVVDVGDIIKFRWNISVLCFRVGIKLRVVNVVGWVILRVIIRLYIRVCFMNNIFDLVYDNYEKKKKIIEYEEWYVLF